MQHCNNDILEEKSLLAEPLTKLGQLIFKWWLTLCNLSSRQEVGFELVSVNRKLIKSSGNPTYCDL